MITYDNIEGKYKLLKFESCGTLTYENYDIIFIFKSNGYGYYEEGVNPELGRVGLDMRQMRLCNLWLHPKNKNEDCLKHGLENAVKEARGRKVILLIGSDTVKQFCNEKVSEVSGLKVESSYLSAPLIFACVQPATVFHGGIGEVRLSLEKLAKKVKEL